MGESATVLQILSAPGIKNGGSQRFEIRSILFPSLQTVFVTVSRFIMQLKMRYILVVFYAGPRLLGFPRLRCLRELARILHPTIHIIFLACDFFSTS